MNDVELASKLAFFLWSSLPDEELLLLAEAGRLSDPDVLEQQVRRMLADARAETLAADFAYQWLHLNRMDAIRPDPAKFPQTAGRLDPRADFLREIGLFVDSIFREDRSVVDLLQANHTFVNETLAWRYGIDGVRGNHFRRVELEDSTRWGLLGKGALLLASSYPNRTSPVLRGEYVMRNLIGVPPDPPPPEVETDLDNVAPEESLTVRERLAIHRENPTCNGCHGLMDPLGFALENFDVDGTWRDVDRESGRPIDASGLLPDGSKIAGPEELREALLARPEQFVQTFVEKLLAYALGRSTEWYDMPAVREVVRQSAADDYRFSAVVMGIVQSVPFTTRDVGEGESPELSARSESAEIRRAATTDWEGDTVVMLTKKRISRRAVLRGAGASIALPLLDAMIPAGVALADTVVKPRTRMGFFYFPHGAFTGKWTEINSWTPAGEGRNFEISQVLKPLEPFRDRMTVVSGLRNRGQEDKAGGVHKSSEQAWLKGVEVRDGPNAGMSIDQIAAREIGQDTSFASLELATEPDLYAGGHSFRTADQVLPMEYNPRKLFDRLFGPGDSLRERATILESTGSVLDRIQAEAQRFQQALGPADRGRMDDYLTSVRDVERQIQNMIAKDFSGVAVPDAPVGIPADVDEQINIMFDLLALAYQADLTRVATLRIAAEQTVRTYTNLGISDAFHPISHHGHRHENYEKLIRIQTYHSQVVARFLAKLDAFPEADGSSVLDQLRAVVRKRHE